jgi:transcription initiation factor TFIIB
VECIIRVANKANLSQNSKRQAINIMNRIIKKKIISAGKDPMGFAGTVLYISCIKTGENITQDNIANAAGVTAVTIKNRFKHLKKQLQLKGNFGMGFVYSLFIWTSKR